MRAVNAKHTKAFQMMVNEQGWTNIQERSCYGSSEQVSSSQDTVNIISRLQQLEKLICDRRRRDSDDSPISVHIRKRGLGYDCQQCERDLQGSKAVGALVTENDRMWRMAHALAGKNYKIPGTSNCNITS